MKVNEPNESLVEFLRAGLSLTTPKEKRRALAIVGLQVIVNWLSTAALLGLLPVVGIIIEPEIVVTNKYLSTAADMVGQPAPETFARLMAFGVITLIFIAALGEWLQLYALNRFTASCQTRLAKELMEKMVAAPYSYFMSRNSTESARFLYSDIKAWCGRFVRQLMEMVNNIIQISVTVISVLWIISGVIYWAVIVLGALTYVALRVIGPIVDRLAGVQREAFQRTIVNAGEAFGGIRDVKLSSRESYFVERFRSVYDTGARIQALLAVTRGTSPIILKVVGQAGLLGVVIVLSLAGASNAQIALQIGALYVVVARVVPAAGKLVSLGTNIWTAAPFTRAIQREMHDLEFASRQDYILGMERPDVSDDWKVLRLDVVRFRYPDSSDYALKDIDLNIEKGRTYGIVGRSAAGKSTLVDLVVGLLLPTSGTIFLDGRPIKEYNLRSWQSKIGYVSQSPFMSDDTLRANVAFGVDYREVDDTWVIECLHMACLDEFVSEQEAGLDTPLHEGGMKLSGGQRQRIAIARALYNRPDILILDEATSALDTISEQEVIRVFARLNRQDITMIIIAHRLTTVMNCDRIILLDHGSLVALDTYEGLISSQDLFREMAAGLANRVG